MNRCEKCKKVAVVKDGDKYYCAKHYRLTLVDKLCLWLYF